MVRNWLFPKKRGEHRTGSAIGGRAGEAAFFLCLFLLGTAGIIGLGWSYFTRSWPVADYFPAIYQRQTHAVVQATRITELPKAETETQAFLPEVLIEFETRSETATIWTAADEPLPSHEEAKGVLKEYSKGQKLVCWFDPAEPTATSLRAASQWGLWLTAVLLLALAVAGAYGVIVSALQVGASQERRAALAQAATTRLENPEDALPSSRDFPTVPRDLDLLNSPGVKLKYRLPATQESAWRLFAAAIWMLSCAGLGMALAVVTVEQLLSSRSAWLMSGFSLCVASLAGWAIYSFLSELVAASWMGPPSLEVSHLPLAPGESCEVYLAQSGNLRASLLRVLLVCDEETTFLQGTDIRHDVQRVHCEEICRREQFAVDASHPIDEHFPLTIPPAAMHSFKSPYNAIKWKLVVEVKAEDWPTYLRSFPLVVYPASAHG